MRWFLTFLVSSVASVFIACSGPMPPTLGSRCNTESIGHCDATAPRLLQCRNGAFVVYADCKGSGGCSATAETVDCDTSGNSVGDRCAPSSEGKVRCDPDGGVNILRCADGMLGVIFTCASPTFCGTNDAGALTCI